MTLEGKILFIFERFWLAFEKKLRDIAMQNKISTLQAKIMLYLLRKGEANIKELANEINVKHSACNSALKALMKKKFVNIYEGKLDRRFKIVSLTSSGKDLAKKLSWNKDFSDAIARLSENQRLQLFFLLFSLTKIMQDRGIISTQKMCFSCIYFHDMYCLFLRKKLSREELRVSCPDFKPA